jgi:hypothetical protein
MAEVGERFWSKTDRSGGRYSCWNWTSSKLKAGYGIFWYERKYRLAHRLAFEAMNGPIPERATIDHSCNNTSCVNPTHLSPMSLKDNVLRGDAPTARNARKTTCKNGHPYDTVYGNRNERRCARCHAAKARARRVLKGCGPLQK